MNKLKFLLATLLFFPFIFSFPTLALAADLNIDCPASSSSCNKSGLDPLFSNSLDGFWYPGKSITKTLNLKNSGSETREMAIKGKRTSEISILENVMHISIVGGTTAIWSGSLADFYGKDRIEMGIFAPGADLDYNMTVSMDSSANNDYQGKQSVFDLTLGFWGEPIPTPTPTSTPGVVLGTGVSAPSCSDTKPGTPTSLTATILGAGSVRLSWASPPQPYTYFLIAYSNDPTTMKWGNPNVGNVTSYTVSGLGTGTYWFWLRAGNNCMPGDFVGPVSSGTIAGIAGAQTVAPGFTQGVLGVETQLPEVTPNPSAAAQILGTECIKSWFPWWIFLILEVITILMILRRAKINKWKLGKLILSLVVIAALSQIAHEITGCKCLDSVWCPKYIWINLAILLFSSAYGLYRLSKKNEAPRT